MRISGVWWEPEDLAKRILQNEPLLQNGGVTVSGGEALMQPEFLTALLDAVIEEQIPNEKEPLLALAKTLNE